MKTLTNKLSIVNCQLSIGLLLLISLSGSAQVITLDSVLAAIDRQNPMLQQYDHKVSALNTYTEGATSWMAPMVGAGPYWYPYPGQKVMDERDKGMFMFNIEQDIPSPGKQHARKEYFNSRAGVEEQGRAIQYNALRSEAKMLYYDWLVLEKKLNVLNENERIVELMLKLARVRYPYNQGSLGNIYKAEGRLYEVQNMILETKSEIEEKGFRLKALMNDPSDRVLKIDTTTNVSFDPNKLLYDTASLLSNRSDVQQINRSIKVMQQNQLLQRAQAKPDFRIRYEHMRPRGDMPKQFSLMAMVSIPIVPWASKMYKSESAGMTYEIEAMKKEQEGILLETKGMLIGIATQLKRMQQQLSNYQTKIIPALRKNYETVMLAYEENREQLPIVIDGWEAWNMAELEYLEKLQNYYSMIVQYEKEIEQ
ncbi:MAG: TolC family protein [Cyclobacteriaceae bacterium]|nr:TolC family protein [Cyclobacteriaceae bacterium]